MGGGIIVVVEPTTDATGGTIRTVGGAVFGGGSAAGPTLRVGGGMESSESDESTCWRAFDFTGIFTDSTTTGGIVKEEIGGGEASRIVSSRIPFWGFD